MLGSLNVAQYCFYIFIKGVKNLRAPYLEIIHHFSGWS